MTSARASGRITTRKRWLALGMVAVVCAVTIVIVRAERTRARAKAAAALARKTPKKYQRPARPVVARAGLPHLEQKLVAHAPVAVVFLGGSITQNGGKGGFVTTIPAWLESRAPGAKIAFVNAGLAATGSDVGARRVERDVLSHRPNLVVVEFAVNDSDRDCVADMERIVRKIRLADPRTDLLFLYCVMDWTLPRLEAGKYPPSVKRHELVAEHYGIPSIALGFDAARRVRLGEWVWANFSPDACHPNPDGYESYNRDLEEALPQVFSGNAPASATLPASLVPDLILDPPITPAPTPTPAP